MEKGSECGEGERVLEGRVRGGVGGVSERGRGQRPEDPCSPASDPPRRAPSAPPPPPGRERAAPAPSLDAPPRTLPRPEKPESPRPEKPEGPKGAGRVPPPPRRRRQPARRRPQDAAPPRAPAGAARGSESPAQANSMPDKLRAIPQLPFMKGSCERELWNR